MYISVGKCSMYVSAHKSRRRVLSPLELELEVAVSHLACVLGSTLESSERAAFLLAD